MTTFNQIILTVCFLGAAQGLILAVSLLSVRSSRTTHRVLGLLMLMAALGLSLISLAHSSWSRGFEEALEALEFTFMGVMPPLLYLYVYVATRRAEPGRKSERIPRSLWLHFLPVLGWLLFLLGVEAGVSQWLGLRVSGSALWPSFAPVVAYQIAYTALAIATFCGWIASETHEISDESALRVWLRGLLASMVIVHIAQLVRMSFIEAEGLDNIVPLSLALAFFAVTNIGFRQSPLVRAVARRRSGVGDGADPVRLARDTERLLSLLEGERRFLDEELTLTSLAGELGWSRTYLSVLINQGLGRNFLELVNDYRLGEARRLLRDPGAEHLTIDAVASRSGFRSRSTFYEVFRRATGQTPSSYRRQQA